MATTKNWPQDSDRDSSSATGPGRGRGTSTPPPPHEEYGPNEHTRLLPNRLDSTPYLSPDDPAVSPYNLWTVRLARVLTVFLTVLTFLWWLLMIISLFVTPPGFHARGSPFFAFLFASVALCILGVELLFFSVPSKSVRILSIVSAVLLLVDTIVILAVEGVRHEEVWIGVASVIWATLVAVWALAADRTVQWGKREEEQRLTGRPETRRTLAEWSQVLISSVVLVGVAVVVFLMTLNLGLRAFDTRLAPPGQRLWVDENKYQIHLYCAGEGKGPDRKGRIVPTVLFEGGEDSVERGLWQFADDMVKNGSISRYCFADRPGMGWSDAAPSPLSASMASDVLSEALVRAGEEGPWVLASAGIGSLYSRVFSSRHGAEVNGILMIDPLHEDLLSRVGAPGRGFKIWLQGAISPIGIDRLLSSLVRGRNSADRIWGRTAYQSGKWIFAKFQESLVAASLTKRDVVSSRAIQYKDTPLVLISSGEQMRRDSEWEAKQRDLSHLTDNLKYWDVIKKAPHRVWDTLEGREMIEKRLKKLVSQSVPIAE
ncbi:hypothetical protein V8F20_009916 [Naviculisporaceae sp. PSN 640]